MKEIKEWFKIQGIDSENVYTEDLVQPYFYRIIKYIKAKERMGEANFKNSVRSEIGLAFGWFKLTDWKRHKKNWKNEKLHQSIFENWVFTFDPAAYPDLMMVEVDTSNYEKIIKDIGEKEIEEILSKEDKLKYLYTTDKKKKEILEKRMRKMIGEIVENEKFYYLLKNEFFDLIVNYVEKNTEEIMERETKKWKLLR